MIWKGIISSQRKLLFNTVKTNIRNISISQALKKNHYDVLGVKKDASQADIKNAYFELSKLYHPDRIAATDENLAKFREISAAYEILGNEQSRKLYDRGLISDPEKVGIDQPDDSDDPIVKFYRQRQYRHKVPSYGKAEGEIDVWTETFYKKARKMVFEKNELFQASKKRQTDPIMNAFGLMAIGWVIICFGFWMNFENHPYEKFMRKMSASLSETMK